MSAVRYDWKPVAARMLFSLFAVFSLYNPSGYSYWHWLTAGLDDGLAKLAVGLTLFGVHMVLWKTVLAVLRPRGITFILLLCVCALALLWQIGAADLTDGDTLLLGLLICLAVILTSGLIYSSIMHRLTGIAHVEEVPH